MIFFLDIDGVFNYEGFYGSEYHKNTTDRELRQFCPLKVELFNQLTDKTNGKIVVSSSWRKTRTLEQLQGLFKRVGFKAKVIGKTPTLQFHPDCNYHYSVPRGCEIKAWLEGHKSLLGDKLSEANYVIIDDDSDMLYWQRDKFIHVDRAHGLLPSDCEKIIQIYNNKTKIKL